MNKILIYGATSYTGKLCAKEMLKHGIEPILAARSKNVQDIAKEFGCDHAIFGLESGKVSQNGI